ncbi:9621_t:CDS:2, partial [Acaulospora morrowiae]
ILLLVQIHAWCRTLSTLISGYRFNSEKVLPKLVWFPWNFLNVTRFLLENVTHVIDKNCATIRLDESMRRQAGQVMTSQHENKFINEKAWHVLIFNPVKIVFAPGTRLSDMSGYKDHNQN